MLLSTSVPIHMTRVQVLFATVQLFLSKATAGLLDEAAALPQACRAPMHWSGAKNLTIRVGNRERTFRLSSPWAERPCPPGPHSFTCGVGPPNATSPLVLYWHGCNGLTLVCRSRAVYA